MPALKAFGRRWRIGSDDFVFPGLSEAFVRFFWVVIGVVVFILHYPLKCKQPESERDLTLYLSMLLVINVVTTIICLAMARLSAFGSIMDPRPRKHVTSLLYLRVPLFLAEVIWTVIATTLVFEGYDMCHFINAVRITVVLEWMLILAVFIGLLIVFNPIRSDEEMGDAALISRRSWTMKTFQLLKFRQDSLMRAALDDIANLIASFFTDENLVISDIMAGLLLVVHSPSNVYSPTVKDQRERPSWMTLESSLHFAKLAASVYGWPTYLMHNYLSPSAYFKLFKRIRCCGTIRCDQVLIIEDNCCLCNTMSFLLSTEESNMNVFPFFVSFRNRLYEVPFVVLFDHDAESVVITIRGSCSLSDVVTDLSLSEEVFTVDVDSDPILRDDRGLDSPDGSEVRVHRGMLRSARYVYDTLKRNSVLEDMFILYQNYSLVVCGHSLGAGVGSLLTLLLKQQYPNVRCFSFSPPGCVVSENGQSEMEQHVMSVVGGDDVVSRISYQSMHKLRESVERELQTTTKAKYEVLIKGIFRLFFSAPWELHSLPALNGNAPTAPSSVNDRATLIREAHAAADYGSQTIPDTASVNLQENRTQLYPPGRILHASVAESNGSKEKDYEGEWISYRCLSEIKLSSLAMTDHLPKNVIMMLGKLIERETREREDGTATQVTTPGTPTVI